MCHLVENYWYRTRFLKIMYGLCDFTTWENFKGFQLFQSAIPARPSIHPSFLPSSLSFLLHSLFLPSLSFPSLSFPSPLLLPPSFLPFPSLSLPALPPFLPLFFPQILITHFDALPRVTPPISVVEISSSPAWNICHLSKWPPCLLPIIQSHPAGHIFPQKSFTA